MADLIITERSNIVALADAIREKTGATGSISLGDMISDVEVNIKSDPILQDKSVTPTDETQVITADDGYDGLDTVTVNAMPTATQATPSITINSSGLITATATQTAGYVTAGSKSTTKQLAFQAAKTITPTTVNQTAISSGYYTGGAITVKGDSNLVAENIKSGISIFGVNGSYEGSGSSGGGSIETCTVTIDHEDTPMAHVVATVVENGVETIYNVGGDASCPDMLHLPVSIYNVKCGSAIVVEMFDDFLQPSDRYIEIDNDATIIDFYRSSSTDRSDKFTTTLVLKAPTTANVDSHIFIM